jgi:hypothetical protein
MTDPDSHTQAEAAASCMQVHAERRHWAVESDIQQAAVAKHVLGAPANGD